MERGKLEGVPPKYKGLARNMTLEQYCEQPYSQTFQNKAKTTQYMEEAKQTQSLFNKPNGERDSTERLRAAKATWASTSTTTGLSV